MISLSHELVSRLKEKKALIEVGDNKHKKIKTALIIGGGGMKGVFSAGVVNALNDLGMTNIFDLVVAVSAGSASASYLLAQQANLAPLLFYDYLANKSFINIKNFPDIISLSYVQEILSKKLPLNQENIRTSRSRFLIGVTNETTGKSEYLDMKDEGIDIPITIFASSSIPATHKNIITIKNRPYYDGVISCGIPIEPALKENYTDILVVLNEQPTNFHLIAEFNSTPLKHILFYLQGFKTTPAFMKTITNMKYRYKETYMELKKAQAEGINIGIIAPEKIKVNMFSLNKQSLQQAAEEAKELTIKLLT